MKNYNYNTVYYMSRFIVEFLSVFPDILTKDELLSRLMSSVKKNILLKKLDNDIVGIFSPKDGTIICNELLDDKMLDSVLFHEFIHAITSDYQKTKCDYHLSSVYGGDKFLESIVSLMEYKFFNYQYGSSKGKNSGYVFDYAEQLESIFGNDFFSYFVKNYTDISPLFSYLNKSNLKLKNICCNVNKIHDLIRYSNKPERVDYINFCLESDIALLLKEYLKSSDLSTYEKLDKINNLFILQQSPNLDIYMDMIKSCNIREFMFVYPKLENICKLYEGKFNKPIRLNDKMAKFLAMKLFGFNTFNDDSINYDDNIINSFFDNQMFYMSVVKSIYQGDLDVSNLSKNKFTSIGSHSSFSSLCISDRLKNGKNVQYSYDKFSCLSRFNNNGDDCFIENDSMDVFVYKPCDVLKLISLLTVGCNFNVIKDIINLFKNNVDTIYFPVTVEGDINIPNYGEKIKIIYEKDDKIVFEEYENDKRINVSYFLHNDSKSLNSIALSRCSIKRR